LLGTLLAACNQTTAETPSTSHITDQQAFAAARLAVLASLKDPDSAKFGTAFTRKTVGEGSATIFYRVTFVPVDSQTDLVCGTVNSKNSFGGYVGMAVFAYRIGRKDVFIDEGAGGQLFGTVWCGNSS
jgi:hypothetical protein